LGAISDARRRAITDEVKKDLKEERDDLVILRRASIGSTAEASRRAAIEEVEREMKQGKMNRFRRRATMESITDAKKKVSVQMAVKFWEAQTPDVDSSVRSSTSSPYDVDSSVRSTRSAF